jgi:hypothetical protein
MACIFFFFIATFFNKKRYKLIPNPFIIINISLYMACIFFSIQAHSRIKKIQAIGEHTLLLRLRKASSCGAILSKFCFPTGQPTNNIAEICAPRGNALPLHRIF